MQKELIVRHELIRRGIDSMRFEDITRLLVLSIPVSVAYTIVSNMEGLVLTEASELRRKSKSKRYKALKTFADEYESSFYEVKNKLKEAQKNGKGNKMCVDVFRPIYVV